MLYPPGACKEIHRADSAPDHPDLPFFPDHEHSGPRKKRGDRTKPYGNPLLDLKRLQRLEKGLRFA